MSHTRIQDQSQRELEAAIRPFLAEVSTMSLATVDPGGRPHACNLYFAPDDGLDLLFVSDRLSQHSLHIAERPDVAGTVYAPVKMWQQIRGVQLHGTCSPIDPGEWAMVWMNYLKKFPHITEVEQLIRSQQFYRIKVSWYRWINNAVKFGYKVESNWPV